MEEKQKKQIFFRMQDSREDEEMKTTVCGEKIKLKGKAVDGTYLGGKDDACGY